MIGQLIAAMIGTVAFAVLFGVERKYYLFCGLIGAFGWGIYLAAHLKYSSPVSAFFAAMAVIFLSRLVAVLEKCPTTIFLIAGLIPLVPGAGIYWTTYFFVTGRINAAEDNGFLALKTAVAIVLGIVFIFEIPQSFFNKLGHLIKK